MAFAPITVPYGSSSPLWWREAIQPSASIGANFVLMFENAFHMPVYQPGLMSQLTSAYLPATLLALHLGIELWDMRCFQEGRSILGRLSPCGPIIVLAVSHPHWVWVTVGKLEPQTWQSCWVGLRPSGINLLRYPCAIHLRFDNGHEERLIYAAASLWKASLGWTRRTLFTLSCLLGLRLILWCKLFFF